MANELMDVNSLIKDIKENTKQKSASQKDELLVMRAMLNDKNYKVDVYTAKDGLIGSYSPYEDSRSMVSNIIHNTTKLSTAESDELANQYEFTKSDSVTMINISKEFVNTYLETGRKLPLGGREKCNASLLLKETPEKIKHCPKQIEDSDGNTSVVETLVTIPKHETVKAISPCPKWLKK